jgi:hypothetical protein
VQPVLLDAAVGVASGSALASEPPALLEDVYFVTGLLGKVPRRG